MNRAGGIVVILNSGSETKDAAGQIGVVLDARVSDVVTKTRGASGQILVVLAEKIGFDEFRKRQGLKRRRIGIAGRGGSARGAGFGKGRVDHLAARTDLVGSFVQGTVLCRQ